MRRLHDRSPRLARRGEGPNERVSTRTRGAFSWCFRARVRALGGPGWHAVGTETLTAGRKAGGVKLSNYAPGGGTI